MQRFNVLTGELPVHQDRPGFVWRGQRGLPRELDLRWLGASVYDLPDGQWTYPYHYHHGIEEWLYVADGAPILRDPQGRDVLAVGDMVVFPEGADGAHQLINESQAVTRVLIVSTKREPHGCVYPDSGKLATLGGVFKHPG